MKICYPCVTIMFDSTHYLTDGAISVANGGCIKHTKIQTTIACYMG